MKAKTELENTIDYLEQRIKDLENTVTLAKQNRDFLERLMTRPPLVRVGDVIKDYIVQEINYVKMTIQLVRFYEFEYILAHKKDLRLTGKYSELEIKEMLNKETNENTKKN